MRRALGPSMLRRVTILSLVAALGAIGGDALGARATPPVTDPALEQDPNASVAPDDSAPTGPTSTTLPPGCEKPDPALAVFVGQLTAKDTRTARYEIVQVRAGSLKGYEVSGLVDVDYFDDVRYLEVGEQYVVGAGRDGITKRLLSTVREPAPLFGGNQVVGVDDSDVDCPVFEAPIRTLMLDGTSVESGVIAPFLDDGSGIARAILLPALWLFLGLVAVAAIKNLLWAAAAEVRWMIRRGDPLTDPAPRRSHTQRRPTAHREHGAPRARP